VRVGEDHRLVEPVGGRADVHPGDRQQPGGEAEPPRGVVVARGEHHLGAGPPQPGEHPVEHGGRVGRGDGAVVHVAGDQDDVDPLIGHDGGQPAEHRLLLGEQVGAVQRPADVPVGGVQQPHGAEGRRPHRQNRPGAP
jgi:hypothetical protein